MLEKNVGVPHLEDIPFLQNLKAENSGNLVYVLFFAPSFYSIKFQDAAVNASIASSKAFAILLCEKYMAWLFFVCFIQDLVGWYYGTLTLFWNKIGTKPLKRVI